MIPPLFSGDPLNEQPCLFSHQNAHAPAPVCLKEVSRRRPSCRSGLPQAKFVVDFPAFLLGKAPLFTTTVFPLPVLGWRPGSLGDRQAVVDAAEHVDKYAVDFLDVQKQGQGGAGFFPGNASPKSKKLKGRPP
jgi:hypothetical protein